MHQTQSISGHHVTEDAVMTAEIEQLPDVTGFLRVGVAAGMAAGRKCVSLLHSQLAQCPMRIS